MECANQALGDTILRCSAVGSRLPLAVAVVVALIGDVVAADCRHHRAGSGARRNHSVDDYRTALHFRSLSGTHGIIDGA